MCDAAIPTVRTDLCCPTDFNGQEELFQSITDAFDDCARAQQELQRKITIIIADLFKEKSTAATFSGDRQGESPTPLLDEVPLHSVRETPLRETSSKSHIMKPCVESNSDLRCGMFLNEKTPQSALEIEEHTNSDSPISVEDKNHRSLQSNQLYLSQGCCKSLRIENSCNAETDFERNSDRRCVMFATEMTEYSVSEVEETITYDSPETCGASAMKDDQRITVFSTWTAASCSPTIFLTTTGKFVRAASFADLPDWIRFTESLLNFESSMVSKLSPFWSDVLDASQVLHVNSIVEATYTRRNFVFLIEKAYRLLDDGALTSRRSSRRSSVVAYRNVARGCRRRTFFTFPLHPTCGLKVSWDMLSIVLCLCDFVLLPMAPFDFDDGTARHVMELCVAVFWTLDICMSFSTSYFDGLAIQRSCYRIALSYVRSWFFVDFAIVLNDWVLIVLLSKDSFGYMRFAKLLKTWVRVVRLIRLWKMSATLMMSLQRLSSETALSVARVATQALVVVLICHYVACGWYALGSSSALETTWVQEYISPEATTGYRYFVSLHWALTQLLPASIKVQPVNETEHVYNIAIIIVAMVVFSSFVSSITVSMNHLRACRIASIERDGQLRKFMAQYDINSEIAHAIWSFIARSARSNRSTIKPDDVLALKALPEHILEDLYKDAFEKQLRVHPLFAFYSTIEPKVMSKLCRTGIEQQVLLSFEVLWHDLMVTRMLFVRGGSLHYEVASLQLDFVVKPSEWACEETIWGVRPHIDVPFSAGVSGCEMLMVNPNVFQAISRNYSQDHNSMLFLARYGEEFTRRFNVACFDTQNPNPLFNERCTVVELLNSLCDSYRNPEKCMHTPSKRDTSMDR